MMSLRPSPSTVQQGLAPALVAAVVWLLLISSLDPAGDYPGAAAGPGVTIDESFNVQQGVRLVGTLEAMLWGEISWRDVFGEAEDIGPNPPAGYHLPDHPPLGRLVIGFAHGLTDWLMPTREHDRFRPADRPHVFVTAAARTAPATAFALTILLIGWATTAWYGRGAGIASAIALALMPRLFGHAHLAALETLIGLIYTATVLSVAAWWSGPQPPRSRTACWTGCVFGLALLTKIHAILLPVPIALWALSRWRGRAARPLLLWGLVGFAVFFVGWPWLWLDPVGHLTEYFGRTTDRAELSVWYFGRHYADRLVPWHYSAVLFLTTVPLGLQLLGFGGLVHGLRDSERRSRLGLMAGCIVFPLVVFSLPGIAVYDGARLFLVSFPLWAVMIGIGSATLFERLKQRAGRRPAVLSLVLLFLLQGYGVVMMRPCYLSYYNLSVGGLRGADRLGLEPTYWGDSVTRPLLAATVGAVPEGATVAVAPVLHRFQLPELWDQSPILRRRGIRLVPFQPDDPDRTRYLLLFRRKADLHESLRVIPPDAEPLAVVHREGVVLAALYRLR